MEKYPPISFAEERKMIDEYTAKGDLKGLKDQLVMRNVGVMWTIAKKYRFAYEDEDLVGIGIAALYKAADSFDPNLNFRFSSWCGRCLQTHFLRTMKEYFSDVDKGKVSLDMTISNDDGDNCSTSDVIQSRIPSECGIVKDGRQETSRISNLFEAMSLECHTKSDRKAFYAIKRHIIDGESYSTVAKELNCSYQWISRIINRFINRRLMPKFRAMAEKHLAKEKPHLDVDTMHHFFGGDYDKYFLALTSWTCRVQKLSLKLLKKELTD